MAATLTARESSPSGNRRTLMLSLLFGLLSAFLIYRLLANVQAKNDAPATVPVIVAKQDIAARTVITDSMLAVKQVPPSVRLANAFTDAKTAAGQASKAPIAAGEQVLTSQVVSNTRELGFSGAVPAGMRAVSISVADVVTDGNLVQPGDTVDVIAVFHRIDKETDSSFLVKDSTDQAKRLVTATLAQDVKVLAVAQSFDDTPGQSSSKSSSAKPQQADTVKTVTVAVSPDDAQRLFLGDAEGTLRLALHRFDDHNTAPLPPLENSVPSVYGGNTTGTSQSTASQPGSPQR